MDQLMTLDELSGPSDRSLLLVHGRDFKPGRERYLDLSIAAMRMGIERDFPEIADSFNAVKKHIAWYGDITADLLEGRGKSYDPELDLGDRRNALAALREIKERKRFGIRQYDRLPGKSAVPEFLADVAAPVLGTVGLAMPLIGTVAPDFAAYFDKKQAYGDEVRARVRSELCRLLDDGDRIMLIAHGTGSVIAYEVLWELTHDPELKQMYGDKKIEMLLTMGSPLGDRNVQKHLCGARKKAANQFPGNVISWHNLAAEDDYTCHDSTLADDYKMMMKQRLVSAVRDYRIFNLAVRYGRSNPHSSIGYFIHPRTSRIVSDWLA